MTTPTDPQPTGLTRDEVVEQYKQGCSFLLYGECTTVGCLRRGGYDGTNRSTVIPTCPEREAVEAGAFRAQHEQAQARIRELEQMYREASDEKSRVIEQDSLYKFVAKERDALTDQLAQVTRRYDEEFAIVDRVWRALGVTSYAQAGGKEIHEIVLDLKQQLADVTLRRAETVAMCEQLQTELTAQAAQLAAKDAEIVRLKEGAR